MSASASPGLRSLLAAVLVIAAASGGCGDDAPEPPGPVGPVDGIWRDRFALAGMSGFGARVEAIVLGPDQRMYAGGIFTDASGVAARNVAVWTGTAWQPLGDGLHGWVKALAFDASGTLWAGGALGDDTTPNRLASWTGTAWSFAAGELDGDVEELAPRGDGLLVVGSFTTAGTTASQGVAIHDAGGWHGIGTTGTTGTVKAILPGVGDAFCIGGLFTAVDGVAASNVACWDGEAWTQLGDGLPGEVAELGRGPDDRVVAGGTVTFIVDNETGAYRAGLMVLDGDTWGPLAGGIDNGFINEVRALTWVGDDLYVGGCFGSAGDAPAIAAANLARLDAQGVWHPVGGGLANDVGVILPNLIGASDLAIDDDGALWVGGVFSTTGTAPAANLARLDGEQLVAVIPATGQLLGIAGFVDALAILDGAVVAGGGFTGAGLIPARNIARLGVAGWRPLGDGLDGIVRALLVRRDGTLVAGGEFAGSGDTAAPFLAGWDGTRWSALGAPLDGPVFALAEDPSGLLYVGGDFTHAGELAVGHIAVLDATGWFTVGAGTDGRVTSLALVGGVIFVGGLFDQADGVDRAGLAIADGLSWASFVGGGVDPDGYVNDFAAIGDAASGTSCCEGLVVAGQFATIGGAPVPDLAVWDGAAWTAVGGGLTDTSGFSQVTAVLGYGDGLFATGTFDHAGTQEVSYLAWWDGQAWHDVGGGLGDLAEAMVVDDNTLWIGGPFVEAGGAPSSAIAAWDFATED